MRRWVLPPYWWHFTGYPQSRVCIRCRDAGVIHEADLASLDSCREHMAEDRINDLIKRSGAWWS